jgi:hypothetical protein
MHCETSSSISYSAIRQLCRRKILCVQQDLQTGEFASHYVLQIECNNILMVT